MKRATAGLAGLVLLTGALAPPASEMPPENRPRTLMTPRDVLALPVRTPDHIARYGEADSQFGELRVPAGKGPHPVVVLVHGGCWQRVAGASFMGAMADALTDDGIATWNIEYRRLGEPGGGWPGTYSDTGRAIDHLRGLAGRYDLDLKRVVLVGHSAGGHLAHWAAARSRLRMDSELYVENPFVPRGVVNLAGRMDMSLGIEAYEERCRGPVVRELLGEMPAMAPTRYADASPQRLLPLGVRQVMIWGEYEEFVPLPLVEGYLRAAVEAGDDARLIRVPGVGHFETASPSSAAWPVVKSEIRSLLANGTTNQRVR